MPGKVNPVIPEVVTQVAAQVIGNDAAITIGGMQGHFELNVFVPLIARNLLQSIKLLASASRLLDEKCVSGIEANLEQTERFAEATLAGCHRAQSAHRLRQGQRDRQEGRGVGPLAARGRAGGGCLRGRARRGARLPQDGAPARPLGLYDDAARLRDARAANRGRATATCAGRRHRERTAGLDCRLVCERRHERTAHACPRLRDVLHTRSRGAQRDAFAGCETLAGDLDRRLSGHHVNRRLSLACSR